MQFPNVSRYYPPSPKGALSTVVLDIGNGMDCHCIVQAKNGNFASRPWIMVGGTPVNIQLEYPNDKLDHSSHLEPLNV